MDIGGMNFQLIFYANVAAEVRAEDHGRGPMTEKEYSRGAAACTSIFTTVIFPRHCKPATEYWVLICSMICPLILSRMPLLGGLIWPSASS